MTLQDSKAYGWYGEVVSTTSEQGVGAFMWIAARHWGLGGSVAHSALTKLLMPSVAKKLTGWT